MRTGQRAIAAPYLLNQNYFVHAIDIHNELKNGQNFLDSIPSLRLGTSTVLSESFQIFSAFGYIPRLGNFIDGGAYDNFGITTIMDFYRCIKTVRPDLKMVLISIENGNSPSKIDFEAQYQIKSLTNYLSSQPFLTYAPYCMIKESDYIRSQGDTILRFRLSEQTTQSFALGRKLSNTAIDTVFKLAKQLCDKKANELRQLDPSIW